jgi:acyl dehydratase
MPKRILDSPDSIKDLIGQELAVTDWFNVTQERIQQFADATLDHQWIIKPLRSGRACAWV